MIPTKGSVAAIVPKCFKTNQIGKKNVERAAVRSAKLIQTVKIA